MSLEYIGGLYEIEWEAKTRPIADELHQWLLAHRQKVPDGSGTAKASDYSLKR